MAEQVVIEGLRFSGMSVEVELSTAEEPLVVDVETAHRYRLAAGTVITESQAALLAEAAQRYSCRREATRLLASRPHAVAELRLKLRKQEYPEEMIREVMGEFRAQGVLDDAMYAHQLAESLVRRKPCGRSYLISYLQSRHIERELAEDIASAVLGEQESEEVAVRALRGRWREFGQFDLETARRKAYNYLSRRGFAFETSRAAFERLVRESTDGGSD